MLFLAIQTDGFQTWLAGRLTSYLSEETQSEISVGRVSIRFFNRALLSDVLIKDPDHDTLFYFKEIGVNLNDISTKHKVLEITSVNLRNGYFNLVHRKGREHDNLFFLTDYFASTDTTAAAPWKITAGSLELEGLRFSYNNYNDSIAPYGVDFSHLDLQSVHGDLHNIHFVNDSIFAVLDRIRFKERSGFTLNDFSGDAKVSGTEIRVHAAHISTPLTELRGDLEFKYDSFADFSDFIHKVKWKGNFASSSVSVHDIAMFAPELKGLDKSLQLEGNFSGTVSKFRGKNAFLRWGKRSYFKGDILMSGLPEIDDTYLDVLAREVNTNTYDLEWIPLPPFNTGNTLQLPDNLNCLGDVRFNGKFTGFFSDFVAFGNATTGIGYVTTDINLKYDPEIHSYAYNGHLATDNFDVGKLTETPHLGLISMDANIKGSGFRIKDLTADLKGTVGKVVYYDYPYQNVTVEGKIAKKLFNGSLSIREADVDFDFGGEIDMRGEMPVFDFKADVRKLQLDHLHLVKSEVPYGLQTSITSRLTGNSIDNLSGDIELNNTFLLAGSKMYHLNKLRMTAGNLPADLRHLEFESDILDADFKGKFELVALPAAFREIIPRYLPNVLLPVKGEAGQQEFEFNVYLKNTAVVTENFLPDLYFDPATRLYGSINAGRKTFDIQFESKDLRYRSMKMLNFRTRMAAAGEQMSIVMNADTFYYSKEGYIPDYRLNADAKANLVDFKLQLSDLEGAENRLSWVGQCNLKSIEDFTIKIDTSRLMIDKYEWTLGTDNRIHFDSAGIYLNDFTISRGEESASIEGWIARDSSKILKVDFKGFGLSHLNPALFAYHLEIQGTANGTADISNLYDDPTVKADIRVAQLTINKDTLGDAMVFTDYDKSSHEILLDLSIDKGSAHIISLKGKYHLMRENDNLDFHLKTDNFYLHTLENLMDEVVTDVRGKVSTDVLISGTLDKPVFEGYADFRKAAVTIPYLNTRYNFSSKVKIHENEFDLSDIKLMDENGHEAGVKGKITHHYLSDFRFDVEVFPRNFQVLNTSLVQNSLYYGKANATGYAHFLGPVDDMSMDIALSPNKGTVINIPLNTTSEVTQSDFITFVNMRSITEFSENTNTVNLSGIRLNMNLDMTPDAEINLVFDEKIGDVISGSGNGSLRLDINTIGDFNMYGTFTIEKGTYLFTLQNLINKRFKIDQGGRITWSGDPYDATIDMTAVYSVYTSSLVNLIQDSTFQRRVPVDCRLNLSSKLMNPSINYEIAVRAQDPTVESMVRTLLNSEQEVSRQMFGLLVFNQFLPPSVNTSSVGRLDAGAGAMASASELLSNQVSNWLSQLSKDVNIGFNYRAKDTYSKEEINLMFSKSLFNDRLLLETNVGVLGNSALPSASANTNNVVGEFYTEYKVSKDGRLRIKAYNKSNADDLINFNAPYTQGAGVFFRQDFNSLKDLKERLGIGKQKDKQEVPGNGL